jgi:two-component system cell cycle sensor histidine kinase/response regulator CckA
VLDPAACELLSACERDDQRSDVRATYERMRWLPKRGDPVDLEVTMVPISRRVRPAVQIVGRDLSYRKRKESELLLADRMASLGTLAAGVGHEINNPLSYVITNLTFALDELDAAREHGAAGGAEYLVPGAQDELRAALGEALEGAQRVRHIVRDLKTFSRADEDTMRRIDVRSVLDSVAALAHNEVRHRARLVRCYDEVPPVEANEARLAQVFMNLLLNAAQAIPDGAADTHTITLATSTDAAGRAVVEVRDTGVGISDEIRQRIFDPFFTTKPVGVGTGLGLAICQSIVVRLGGEIKAESERGKETVFRVVLPAAPVAVTMPPTRTSSVVPSHAPMRLLIVDDEPAIGSALRRLLRDCDVTCVQSGREAVRLLSAGEDFDAIVCDVMMPGFDGERVWEAARQLRSGMEKRFVFMTGGAFTPQARAFLDRVPNPWLMKPIDIRALRTALETRLEPGAGGALAAGEE